MPPQKLRWIIVRAEAAKICANQVEKSHISSNNIYNSTSQPFLLKRHHISFRPLFFALNSFQSFGKQPDIVPSSQEASSFREISDCERFIWLNAEV